MSKDTDQPKQSLIHDVMSSFFYTCYRIVDDNYSGYEVQIKRWFFPFYVQKYQYGFINTFRTIDDAKNWIDKGCPKDVKMKYGKVVYWQNCS